MALGFIGSILQLNFGERTEEKGFTLVDTDTWEVQFIRNRAAPVFRFFEEPHEFADWICSPAGIRWLSLPLGRRDYIRANCGVNDLADLNVEYPHIHFVPIDNRPETQDRVDAENISTDRGLLEEWISRKASDELDAEELLQMGIGFLEEV